MTHQKSYGCFQVNCFLKEEVVENSGENGITGVNNHHIGHLTLLNGQGEQNTTNAQRYPSNDAKPAEIVELCGYADPRHCTLTKQAHGEHNRGDRIFTKQNSIIGGSG